MLSPLIQQQDSFFFDVLMSDPKALASLSDELYSCVTTASSTMADSTTAISTSLSCADYQVSCTPFSEASVYAANPAPVPTSAMDLSAYLPPRPERPTSSSSGGRDMDIESAESISEASTSATTPTAYEAGMWDHELLHPRVLGREESALFRRQRAARREQRRLALQRDAFEKLQEALPGNTSRMSRLDLLRLAIKHIQDLNGALDDEYQETESNVSTFEHTS